MSTRLTLRRLITATLLFFSVLMSAVLFVAAYWTHEHEAVDELGEQLRYAAGSLAANLEWAVAAGDDARVQALVSQEVTRPHLHLVVFADSRNEIRAATDARQLGQSLLQLQGAPGPARIERVRSRRAGEVFEGEGEALLWAVFPVSQPPAYREVRSERAGLVLIALEMRPLRRVAMLQALQLAAIMLVPMLLLSLALAWIARRQLSDRVEQLLDYARDLVAGEAPPEPPVRGRDELGLLARELDELMQQIVASRDFHALLLDRLPNPVWRCDASGRRDYFNAAWLAFTGRSLADEQGDGWLVGLDAAERESSEQAFQVAFVRRSPYVREFRLRRADGSWHWLEERGEPLFDAAGRFIGYLGSCFDRQKERQAAEQMAESEARFRGLVERSLVGVYEVRDELVAYANPRLAAMFGYHPDEMVGLPVARLVSPEDRYLVSERLRRRMAGDTSNLQFSFMAMTRQGLRFPVDAFGSRIVRDGAAAVIGSILDVGDRRRAEQALRASEARFRATFEQAAVGVAHMALDGAWLQCNDCLCGMFGYSSQELQELSMPALTHPDDRDRTHRLMASTLAGKQASYTCEKRYLRRDGSVLWVNVSATLLRADNGAPLYFVVVIQDISGRKEAEAQLHALNAELEARIDARTGELAAANKELETFAYSVSHDLKTPLRGIDGYSRILLEDYGDRLDDTGRAYLGRICKGVGTMGQLIDDLLGYSRMERQELSITRVRLAPVIAAALAERESELSRDGVETQVEVDEGLEVMADRAGLALVVRNLLDNAIKYSRDAAPPVIRVGASRLDGSVRLWVADNGIGFDMAYHNRIFEIFQRLGRVEAYAGTGVGLAMVRRALDRMGGRVWAESALNHGATFTVELPAPPQASEAEALQSPSHP